MNNIFFKVVLALGTRVIHVMGSCEGGEESPEPRSLRDNNEGSTVTQEESRKSSRRGDI